MVAYEILLIRDASGRHLAINFRSFFFFFPRLHFFAKITAAKKFGKDIRVCTAMHENRFGFHNVLQSGHHICFLSR